MHTLKLISCLGVCNVISECFKHIFIWCMHMLKLISCLGVCNVVSECLNTLIVISFMTMLPKLEIVAPKLESLQIEGSVDFLSKIEIKDVMALLKVKLIVNNVIPAQTISWRSWIIVPNFIYFICNCSSELQYIENQHYPQFAMTQGLGPQFPVLVTLSWNYLWSK